MSRDQARLPILCLALALVVLIAYSNHFENGFHFDDFHTITGNPFIRDLHNIPQFFKDPAMFSTMPDHAAWRPITSVSLAIDYWLSKGLKPFYFQLSTFVWFLVQITLMFFLFRRMMDQSDPHPSNLWVALAAAALYGLHPANAETINYVIQRGDVLSTVGLVASLGWFAAKPAQRKFGLYLFPAVAAYLAKAPALIFPLILLAYVHLFEINADYRRWRETLRAVLPALVVTIASAILMSTMTPASFNAGATSDSLYRLTQPWVALHYFKSFFLPTELSADSDWGYVSDWLSTEAVVGYLFVMGLIAAAWRASRNQAARPIAFGIIWFFLALLPVALMPLAEVTNDHRMFFPFVGLTLAVLWSIRLAVFKKTGGLTVNLRWARGSFAVFFAVILVAIAATRQRNEVWHTDDALWKDVVLKSPKNGRGLMNYGLTFLSRGDYPTALSYFQRAEPFTPSYWALEVNLALADSGLNMDSEAERHFGRALMLAPTLADPLFYYGRWLSSKGRTAEAIARLESALQLNKQSFEARDLLTQLRNIPINSAQSYLDLSLREYQAGRYESCIEVAKKALELKPDYAEAYNNISAAYNAMAKWDEGIQAAMQAIRINPDYQLAKNNMAWAVSQKKAGATK